MTKYIAAVKAAIRIGNMAYSNNAQTAVRCLNRWLNTDNLNRDFGVLGRDVPKFKRGVDHRFRIEMMVDNVIRNACFATQTRGTAASDGFADAALEMARMVYGQMALRASVPSARARLRLAETAMDEEEARQRQDLQNAAIDGSVK